MTDTEARSFNRNESATPRNPSNRSVITQMERWGWQIVKTGKYVTMRAPIGDETVGVQAANKHDANATSVLLTIYRLTTQSDADLFWRGPSKLWTDMIDAQRAKERDERRKKLEQPEIKAHMPAAWDTPTPKEPTVPEPEPKQEPSLIRANSKYVHMATREQVIEVLQTTGKTMDAAMICRRLGLNPLEERERRCVSNHLSALYLAGRIQRPKAGKYRVLAPISTVRPGPSPIAVTPTPAVARSVAPAAPPVAIVQNEVVFAARKGDESVDDVDDVIEAVLDLLLPQGFQAKDLRVISPWIEATKLMVGTVTR